MITLQGGEEEQEVRRRTCLTPTTGMGKKKSGSRFSLSSVLPTAWLPKLRWAERGSSESTSTATCRYASHCTGGKTNSELSLPRMSIGEEPFHGSDEYLRCRADEYDLPRSSCGSYRPSVSTTEVAPIFTEMVADAKRSKVETGGAFPFPDPVTVPVMENRFARDEGKESSGKRADRSQVEAVAVRCREFPAKGSVSFLGNRGAFDLTLLDPVLLPKTAQAVNLRSWTRNGLENGNHPSTESVPLPEAGRSRSSGGRDGSKPGGLLEPCSVVLPDMEVRRVDGGTESVVRTKRTVTINGETFPAKESAELRETDRDMEVRDLMACTDSEFRFAGECQIFPRENLQVLPERESLGNAHAGKEAQEIPTGCVNSDSHFFKGKVNRFPSLYSVLFPEAESTQITGIGSGWTKSSESESKLRKSDNYPGSNSGMFSETEYVPNRKVAGEFAPQCARAEMRSANERDNFLLENRGPFQEMERRTRSRGWTRSISSEAELIAGKLRNSSSTDSVIFPCEVKNVRDRKDGIERSSHVVTFEVQPNKGKIEMSSATESVLLPEEERVKSVRIRTDEAELSTRTIGSDSPRRRSFKGRRKSRNGRIVGDENEKCAEGVHGFRTEENRKEFELKVTKILGFDPGSLGRDNSSKNEKKFDLDSISRNSDLRNSGGRKKISSDHRNPGVDRNVSVRKPSDRKISKENEFKSLLLRKLVQKKPELMQNSRIQQPRDPESAKVKQRPKIRVSSPRVEIRARKSFQGERRKKERAVAESFAVVKRSFDPQEDFRESMVEMISQNGIGKPEELESLLASYLSLNSDEHHDVIVKVFRQVWFDLSRACLVSDYLDLEGNRRV